MLKSGVVLFLYPNDNKFPETIQQPRRIWPSCYPKEDLFFDDKERVCRYIRNIGYYRLSAYFYPFLEIPKDRQIFKQGSSFEAAIKLYRFDKKLRLFMFNEIEKIEVAVRCAIVDFGTEMTGNPFWMTDGDGFSNPSKFNRSLRLIEEELNHTKEDFINHFKETYSNQYPPSWMLTEILPFGVITNIYSNIRNKKIKKRIAQSFGLQVAPFESWLTIIAVARSSCCHHARIWNKNILYSCYVADENVTPLDYVADRFTESLL